MEGTEKRTCVLSCREGLITNTHGTHTSKTEEGIMRRGRQQAGRQEGRRAGKQARRKASRWKGRKADIEMDRQGGKQRERRQSRWVCR